MKTFRLIIGSIFLFLLLPRVAGAATFTVNCPGQKLQAALDAAGVDDTINVTGTCNENVVVDNNKMKVYLEGGGTAIIHGDPSLAVIDVRGKAILVQGFTITGGRVGIEVHRGSNAVLNDNIIQNMSAGIVVDEVAFAVITNNVITTNPLAGILIQGNAAANIGVNSASDPIALPNFIQANGEGVLLSGAVQANIIGNTISNNSNTGITLNRGAQANIAKNTINGNNSFGILAFQGAGANLGGATFGGIFPLLGVTNSTTVNNGGAGIGCGVGAYIAGNLGTLNGNGGVEAFFSGSNCDDSMLSP